MIQTKPISVGEGLQMSQDGTDVACQKCHRVFGQLVHENGRTLLSMNGLRMVMVEGQCEKCGTLFRWTASARALDRLLKHYPKS